MLGNTAARASAGEMSACKKTRYQSNAFFGWLLTTGSMMNE
jgi:hypothetical protein